MKPPFYAITPGKLRRAGARQLRPFLLTLREPDLVARLRLARDIRAFTRVGFLSAAVQVGLLAALPASGDELIERLGIERRPLFQLLLDLGLSLGELGVEGDSYMLLGVRSRALAGAAGEPFSALVEEVVTYHASVYAGLAARLRGAPLGDYLEATASVVARSSRVFEPYVRDAVRTLVRPVQAPRLLDVGCGSGVYLKAAAATREDATGLGIDLAPEVVRDTAENLRRWGIADRFTVTVADIGDPDAPLDGPFDLVLLLNNIYYFPPEERSALFRHLRRMLREGGALLVVSMLHGTGAMTLDLDLILASTRGCHPLPDRAQLIAELRDGGFGEVRSTRLIPGQPFYGIEAR